MGPYRNYGIIFKINTQTKTDLDASPYLIWMWPSFTGNVAFANDSGEFAWFVLQIRLFFGL